MSALPTLVADNFPMETSQARKTSASSNPNTSSDVYEGYQFFKADPIPGQEATWTRVERTKMHFTQDEFFKMVQRRQNKVSAAQQYGILSDVRRAHVDQLIHERRKAESPATRTCIPTRDFEIPGRLGGHFTKALGDTGAKRNFISEQYANDLGLPIDRNIIRKAVIGSGKQIRTVGMITAPFCFQDERRVYDLHFYVFPGLIHDVILGKPFLKLTETLTNFSNFCRRVKERVINSVLNPDLLFLGASSYMFQGSINDHSHTALADSGAKVLVMDEAYAQSIGVTILTEPEHITKLRFADGSTVDTSGMAYDVRWRFGCADTFTSPYSLDFHILRNAPANVILCDSFLYQHNAFSRYHRYLLDDDDTWDEDDDEFAVLAIDIDKKAKMQTMKMGIPCSIANLEFLEVVRRGEEEERIAALSENERATAQTIESQRRAEWDKTYANLQTNSQPHILQLHFEDAVARLKPISPAPCNATYSENSVSNQAHQRRSFKWLNWHKRGQPKNCTCDAMNV